MYNSYIKFVANFCYNAKIFSRKKEMGKCGMNENKFTVTKLGSMYKTGYFKTFYAYKLIPS
jgi:hypothetical protein